MKREKFMLDGAVTRLRNRQLSMAWEKWQCVAGEMARQQHMTNGAVSRTRKRQVSMAWEKWQYEASCR